VIQDDGAGFIPQDMPPAGGKGNGVGNMRRRAATMGGTITVQSAPGTGTTVSLVVNLSLLTASGAT
jgi:signal transduction histidine kinase